MSCTLVLRSGDISEVIISFIFLFVYTKDQWPEKYIVPGRSYCSLKYGKYIC